MSSIDTSNNDKSKEVTQKFIIFVSTEINKIVPILAMMLLVGGILVALPMDSIHMATAAPGFPKGVEKADMVANPTVSANFLSSKLLPLASLIKNKVTHIFNNNTSPSPELVFSPWPIWDEITTTSGATRLNETHTRIDFIGNGTMTVPTTAEVINMTNSGYRIVTGNGTIFTYGREYVRSEDDGDKTAITFYGIIRYNATSLKGNGIVIAAFDNNATGSLAPFNGMMVAGVHEEDPDTGVAIIRLWEWTSGLDYPYNIPSIKAINAVKED